MSVRIAGGTLAGRSLTGPPRARPRGNHHAGPAGVRPTAVRLRKSLFAVWEMSSTGPVYSMFVPAWERSDSRRFHGVRGSASLWSARHSLPA